MAAILPKLIEADVVAWSFPLYYYSVPGPLKNLIDRQLPTNLPFMLTEAESGGHPSRYNLDHQRHVVISICGFWTAEGNYDGFTALFDHFCGPQRYTHLFCGQGELFRVPELAAHTQAALVGLLSLLLLLGVDAQLVLPLSYGAFGLMWLIGAFTKIPLTAHYSAAGYGGERL